MKENIEPGYMAKIEWEFEMGAEYPHNLTRVVKYSTYVELLSRFKALEEERDSAYSRGYDAGYVAADGPNEGI